jgi:hypothetical protein
MRQTQAIGLSISGGALVTREERTERAGAFRPLCSRLLRRVGRLCSRVRRCGARILARSV